MYRKMRVDHQIMGLAVTNLMQMEERHQRSKFKNIKSDDQHKKIDKKRNETKD